MSDTVQFTSRVGDDGVLNVQVSLGSSEAKKEVLITIESVAAEPDVNVNAKDWHEFVERTYGSCAGLGLERHDQGEFEHRESIT